MWRTAELRSLLLLTLIVGTLAINFPVVLPLIAKVTFDGNADTYSVMTIAMGIPRAVRRAGHRPPLRPRRAAAVRVGPGLRRRHPAWRRSPRRCCCSSLLIALVGAGQIAFMSTCNTMAQLRADPAMRGRVMAVYMMAVLGSTPDRRRRSSAGSARSSALAAASRSAASPPSSARWCSAA